MQALFSTFLRLYIIFFAAGKLKNLAVLCGFSGFCLCILTQFLSVCPYLSLVCPAGIGSFAQENGSFSLCPPLLSSFPVKKFFLRVLLFAENGPTFRSAYGDYNIKCAPTQSLRRYYLQFFRFLVSPRPSLPVSSACPSFATGSRLMSSPCSRQKANHTGQAPRHFPKGPAARRTSPRCRSPASTCKKYAPRHIHRHEGAWGHLL